jgi:hypothetical protein
MNKEPVMTEKTAPGIGASELVAEVHELTVPVADGPGTVGVNQDIGAVVIGTHDLTAAG